MYAEHATAVRWYARRFTTEAHADDIVQETFIRAWRHVAQLDDGQRPGAALVAEGGPQPAHRRRPT